MTTPTELFTEQYMKIMEAKAKEFSEENKQSMIDSALVIIALYLGAPKSQGYSFKFPGLSRCCFC